jgi:molecular chaperone IbpA
MTNVLTLSAPLMRRTVGFDRFNEMFDSLFEEKSAAQDHYPPHNIEKIGEDDYRITIAVAGFSEGDINIVFNGDTLSISGERQDAPPAQETEVLYQGIAARSFERNFRLADHIKVMDADLKNGLLTIALKREIPEEKKPRFIKIKH